MQEYWYFFSGRGMWQPLNLPGGGLFDKGVQLHGKLRRQWRAQTSKCLTTYVEFYSQATEKAASVVNFLAVFVETEYLLHLYILCFEQYEKLTDSAKCTGKGDDRSIWIGRRTTPPYLALAIRISERLGL